MSQTVEPIRKQIVVAAPKEHAFRVFTQKFESWWPREHSIGKSPLESIRLEGKLEGRWYEVGEDGSECNWGKVLAWEPPHRLVLAWQITASWTFDPNFVTELEVRFQDAGDGRTRVELEHRNLERFGDAAQQTRELLDRGWDDTARRYIAAILAD